MGPKCRMPNCTTPIERQQGYVTLAPFRDADADQKEEFCLPCAAKHIEHLLEDPVLSLHQFISRRMRITDLVEVNRLYEQSYGDFMDVRDLEHTAVFMYPTELIILDNESRAHTHMTLGNADYCGANQDEFEAMEWVLYQYYLSERCGVEAYEWERHSC